ncbi:Aste57867_18211 [Aphanomyces stellatus]|uniref:Transmembrane protein 198 n=1 Tax=Aphanomyces stellatus TaxID=120398 RepID=A0A485LB72_9STRA|nr:hypothetical protein As57867_018149 [Aphanomyces stellatus]VFT94949.1 Aste57867_18211 [Aphanomyces stellatus]
MFHPVTSNHSRLHKRSRQFPMYLSNNRGDEPLLGPPQPRKRILGPSILLSPRSRHLAMTGASFLAIAGFAFVTICMLSADLTTRRTSYLAASANDTAPTAQVIGTVAPAVIYALSIGGGALLGFFGYRFIRAAFFAAGFTTGLVVFFDFGTQIFKDASWVVAGSLVLAFVCAIIVGLLALFLYRYGIAFMGILAGIALGAFLGSLFFMQLNPTTPEIPMIISMLVCGVILGLVAFFEEKPVIIICTSFLGAFFVVLGAGNFIGQYPTLANIQSLLGSLQSAHMPAAWWGYFAATIVLWLICIAVQVELTAIGVDHAADAEKKANARRPPRPASAKAAPVVNIVIGADGKPAEKPPRGSFKTERGI